MNIRRSMLAIMLTIVILTVCGLPAFAAGTAGTPEEAGEESAGVVSSAEQADATGSKAWAAALAIGLAAAGGALGMGMAISKSAEGISRQPEAEGRIRTSMMLGLVFVETAIIYALIVAILIIFVL